MRSKQQTDDARIDAAASPVGRPEGCEGVLIVDDDPAVLECSSKMIERLGYKVHEAWEGAMAVDVYARAQHEIAVVLLDLSMPGVDGEECLARLRIVDPDVLVLLCSGHDVLTDQERFRALGASGVIQKPYGIRVLAEALRTTIEGREYEVAQGSCRECRSGIPEPSPSRPGALL